MSGHSKNSQAMGSTPVQVLGLSSTNYHQNDLLTDECRLVRACFSPSEAPSGLHKGQSPARSSEVQSALVCLCQSVPGTEGMKGIPPPAHPSILSPCSLLQYHFSPTFLCNNREDVV